MISHRSSSTSRSHATGRLLTWAVAAAMACGTLALSGTANAAVPVTTAGAGQKAVAANGPWLDEAFVPLISAIPGQVFAVSQNGGVPWVYDPRAPAGQRWINLRRVPASQGGAVSNITIAPDSGVGIGSVHLVIKARTAAGIYQTLCTVQTPASAQQLFPATGPLTNCTPWAPLAT